MESNRDVLSIFVIVLLVLVLLMGFVTMRDHSDKVGKFPHCTEDEWRDPDTMLCVHIDKIKGN